MEYLYGMFQGSRTAVPHCAFVPFFWWRRNSLGCRVIHRETCFSIAATIWSSSCHSRTTWRPSRKHGSVLFISWCQYTVAWPLSTRGNTHKNHWVTLSLIFIWAILNRITRIYRPNPSALTEHGTTLAQTRTRPFDAVALHEYTAAGVLWRICLDFPSKFFLKAPTRLTQSFIRQGARMFANMPYYPTR
jgi:hypothetical protein